MVGVPFRLGGRDPAFGLDCVGLVLASYALDTPANIPRRASLNPTDRAPWERGLRHVGFTRLIECEAPMAGDVWLLDCGHGRRHLAVLAGDKVCHAHAGLGEVIASPVTSLAVEGMRALSCWRFCAASPAPFGIGSFQNI